jgi:hypothetical protein
MLRKSEISVFNGVDEFEVIPKKIMPRYYGTYQYKPTEDTRYSFKKYQTK